MSAEPCSHSPSRSPSDECRCHCGSLLARIVDGAVELKCRRCKRTHRVPIEHGPQDVAGNAPGRTPHAPERARDHASHTRLGAS